MMVRACFRTVLSYRKKPRWPEPGAARTPRVQALPGLAQFSGLKIENFGLPTEIPAGPGVRTPNPSASRRRAFMCAQAPVRSGTPTVTWPRVIGRSAAFATVNVGHEDGTARMDVRVRIWSTSDNGKWVLCAGTGTCRSVSIEDLQTRPLMPPGVLSGTDSDERRQ